jgi:hypothetical protein
MILNSDLILSYPLWERADDELCGKEGIALFNRLVDVYILACSIGIKDDKAIQNYDDQLISPKSIGRNTYMSPTNTNLRDLLDFMLQNALLNSSLINFDIDERLKLAFDPDYNVSKLSAAQFLTGFANYGIKEIFDHIDSKSSIVAVDELYKYLNSIAESKYDDILKNITLEQLKNL